MYLGRMIFEKAFEDRLHQIANALWVLSSFLTMRGNSAVTRLAQGWMLAGVLALDWSALVWVRRRSTARLRSPSCAWLLPGTRRGAGARVVQGNAGPSGQVPLGLSSRPGLG